MNKYTCLNCGNECEKGRSKTNKFCSNLCQAKYRWVNDTIPRIERGDCGEPTTLKKYLIEVHGYRCNECGNPPEWMGKPLTLQLDHIDGYSDTNHPSNLRLLCPNCHTQTLTYGSKGRGNRYKKESKRNVYLRIYKNNSVP